MVVCSNLVYDWMEPVAKTHILSYNAVSSLSKSTITVSVDAANLQDGDKLLVDLLEGGE